MRRPIHISEQPSERRRLKAQSAEFFVQFIKFGLVGISNTLLGYAIYCCCIYVGVHYLIANLVGFVLSVLNAFIWSNAYVFKDEKRRRNWALSLIKTYISYSVTGLFLNSALLFGLVSCIHICDYVAQLICLSISVPLNFILNKYWAFRS